MSRKFKFRAWDDKNKEWLLGYELENLGGFSLFGECILMGEWERVAYSFVMRKDGKEFDDLKVMQYTGLKDKNGTEIYEGDIIDEKYRWVVKYESGVYMAEAQLNGTMNTDILSKIIKEREQAGVPIEVIGNIYESKELLKAQATPE